MDVDAVDFVRTEGQVLPLSTPVPAIRLAPRLRWRLTQAALDFVTVSAAAFTSYWVYVASRLGVRDFDPEFYLRIDLTLALTTVFALQGYGAYRGQFGILRIESIRRILQAAVAGVVIVLALSFFMKLSQFSRLHMLFTIPFVAFGLIGQRFALWRLQEWIRARRRVETPVLLYGAGETGRLLAQHMLTEHALGIKPVGFLDDREDLRYEEVRVGPGVNGERLRVLGSEDDLERAIERTGAKAVFLAMPSAGSERTAELVGLLEAKRIPFACVPTSGGLLFSTLSFGQVGSLPVFTRRRPAADPAYAFVKRAVDLAGAALLLVVTSPLLAAGALAVRLTSPGPIVFRQTRIGLNGRPFVIFKLRTMARDAPKYAEHPASDSDPRITTVGRWLRRTCVDELPQLWNVLRGDMSLVGPRPEMPFVVESYTDIERQRLSVKPGVTGLWQISADRAYRIHDNMHYDLYYVENRDLSLDAAILLMTPFVMMARDRAV